MRRLTAAHAKGKVRALKPCAHHLSPALGLLSLGAHHWHGNLVRSSVPSPSTALARELFAEPTRHSPVRLSRSRSRAAAHLGSAQIGTILGLGLNNSADAHDVKTALNRAGIETNRVHGEWTGVSLRRFLRLVELVRVGRVVETEPEYSADLRRSEVRRGARATARQAHGRVAGRLGEELAR